MKYPVMNWIRGFPSGGLDLHKPSGKKFLFSALDTEHTKDEVHSNKCISYQFAILNDVTGKYVKEIYYPLNGIRLNLNEILLKIFEIAHIPPVEMDGYHIVFTCHFCAAEWAMLEDRKEIAKHFEYLYKTLITFKAIPVSLELDNGERITITFEMGDTMLLLPVTHRSLDKASSLLDEEFRKKELSASEKSRMDLLLRRDKQRFEEYAIHDADITLRLFIKLQYTLNELNGTENTRYTTIGSATVKHFVKSMDKKLFKSQFGKGNSIYQKGLNLAKRAYMGGLNNSYYVGAMQSELFLDIDFSAAYPTVMNLLEVSDFGETPPKKKKKDIKLSLGGKNA